MDLPITFEELFERHIAAPLAELVEAQVEKDDGRVTHVIRSRGDRPACLSARVRSSRQSSWRPRGRLWMTKTFRIFQTLLDNIRFQPALAPIEFISNHTNE